MFCATKKEVAEGRSEGQNPVWNKVSYARLVKSWAAVRKIVRGSAGSDNSDAGSPVLGTICYPTILADDDMVGGDTS